MARPKVWDVAISLDLKREALELIDAALSPGESRASFMRSTLVKEACARMNAKAISASWQASQSPD